MTTEMSHPAESLNYNILQAESDNVFQFSRERSDVILIIRDHTGQNQIIMNAHKLLLMTHCPFFRKILTDPEKIIASELTVEVEYPAIAYDLVSSWHGQVTNYNNFPLWFHLLEIIKLSHQWELPIDHLTILDIPRVGYLHLLDTIKMVGPAKSLLRALIRFRPESYTWDMINESIAESFLEKTGIFALVRKCVNSLDSSDPSNVSTYSEFCVANDNEFIYQYKINDGYENLISSDNGHIVGIIYDTYIDIIDIMALSDVPRITNPSSNLVTKRINFISKPRRIIFSPNGRYLGVQCRAYLYVYSVKTSNIISKINTSINTVFDFSHDVSLIAITTNKMIQIHNLQREEIITHYIPPINGRIRVVKYSFHFQKIAIAIKHNLFSDYVIVIDFVSSRFKEIDKYVDKMEFFHHANKLVMANKHYVYVWYLDKNKIVPIYYSDDEIKKIHCPSPDIIQVATKMHIIQLNEHKEILNIKNISFISDECHVIDHEIEYLPLTTYYHEKTDQHFFN